MNSTGNHTRARGSGTNGKPPQVSMDLPPHSLTTEGAILGSCLTDEAAADTAISLLTEGDFWNSTNRLSFSIIAEQRAKGEVPHFHPLVSALCERTHMNEEEARRYVMGMVEPAPDYLSIAVYCRDLKKLTVRRQIIEASEREKLAAQEGYADPFELAEERAQRAQAVLSTFHRERVEPISVAALIAMDLPPIRFLVERILPQGLALLHSRPKTGKTRLADALAVAVSTGGRFLGKLSVDRTGVLCIYLEDTEQSAQPRFDELLAGEPAPPDLFVHFTWKRVNEGGLTDLADFLERHPTVRLVIIDTLQMIRPLKRSGDDIYAEDVYVLRQLKNVADRFGATFVVLHHSKKGSEQDDVVDSAGGTSGNTGSADTVIRLRKVVGSDDELVLEGRGRKVFDFSLLIKTGRFWELLGETEKVKQSDEQAEVIEALSAGPMRPADLASELGIARLTAAQRLHRLAKKGILRKSAGGWYSCVNGVNGVNPVSGVNVSTLSTFGVPVPEEPPVDTVDRDDSVDGIDTVDRVDTVDSPLPEPLDLPPEVKAEEADLRRRIFNLAWTQGFPPLQIGSHRAMKPGEDNWRLFAASGVPKALDQVLGALEQAGGPP